MVEWRRSSCITLSSVPMLLKRVEYVCRNVCQPNRVSIPSSRTAGLRYLCRIACPQYGCSPIRASRQSSELFHLTVVNSARSWLIKLCTLPEVSVSPQLRDSARFLDRKILRSFQTNDESLSRGLGVGVPCKASS